jgi:hypothetical protein
MSGEGRVWVCEGRGDEFTWNCKIVGRELFWKKKTFRVI